MAEQRNKPSKASPKPDRNSDESYSKESIRKKENPLRIGMCTIDELEEKIKAFRIINQTALKKRYLLSREDIPDGRGNLILQKSIEIDIPQAKLLRRNYPGDYELKTFQPDEGIVIVSDMSDMKGISMSMDIVTQIMNLGGGAYEGFIDRVDSFGDFLTLLKKALFPRLVIIGYLPADRLDMELANFSRAKKIDTHIRALELTHTTIKPRSYFHKMKQVEINTEDAKSWARFILEVIREYTKPYFTEDF